MVRKLVAAALLATLAACTGSITAPTAVDAGSNLSGGIATSGG